MYDKVIDCIVNYNKRVIYPASIIFSIEFLKKVAAENSNWQLANFEEASAKLDKHLTPIIINGINIYNKMEIAK